MPTTKAQPERWTVTREIVDAPREGESGTIYEYEVHEGKRLLFVTYDERAAYLAAAAPDLLAALKRAEPMIGAPGLDTAKELAATLRIVRAAIEKAEGR